MNPLYKKISIFGFVSLVVVISSLVYMNPKDDETKAVFGLLVLMSSFLTIIPIFYAVGDVILLYLINRINRRD